MNCVSAEAGRGGAGPEPAAALQPAGGLPGRSARVGQKGRQKSRQRGWMNTTWDDAGKKCCAGRRAPELAPRQKAAQKVTMRPMDQKGEGEGRKNAPKTVTVLCLQRYAGSRENEMSTYWLDVQQAATTGGGDREQGSTLSIHASVHVHAGAGVRWKGGHQLCDAWHQLEQPESVSLARPLSRINHQSMLGPGWAGCRATLAGRVPPSLASMHHRGTCRSWQATSRADSAPQHQ